MPERRFGALERDGETRVDPVRLEPREARVDSEPPAPTTTPRRAAAAGGFYTRASGALVLRTVLAVAVLFILFRGCV